MTKGKKTMRLQPALFGAVLSVLFFAFSTEASALTISPPRLEIAGDPGAILSGEIKLTNEQDEAKTFYVSYENFEAKGETGEPSFTPSKEDLAGWIATEDSITLILGEERKVPYTITIPEDAEPGGYFSAIFWGTNPPVGEGGQVSIGAKIGTLVLLRVNGDMDEKGGILEFSSKDGRRFFTSLPVNFYYRFQNIGADRLKPTGEIRMKNMLWLTSAKMDANPQDGNVLPKTTRRFEVIWGDGVSEVSKDESPKTGFLNEVVHEWRNFAFGRYKANLDLTYGVSETRESVSFVVYVFPWRLSLVALATLLILYWLGKKGMKRYEKKVIARHMKKRK